MPRLSRRRFLQLSAVGTAGALTAPAFLRHARAADRKKNVLFIAVDDLKPLLNCYGCSDIHSPNLDQLAATATTFNYAYCQQAVCSPSRTSLLTGCRPDTTKVYDLETHFRKNIPNVVTLPQHFKDNGYHSQGFSKIYHGGLDDKASWSVPHVSRPPSPEPHPPSAGGYFTEEGMDVWNRQQKMVKEGKLKKNRAMPWEAPDVPDDQTHDGATALAGCQALEQLKDQAFFLAVGFLKPHLPFCAPKKYWDLYDPSRIQLSETTQAPDDAPAFAGHTWGELRAYYGIPDKGPLTEEQSRKMIHGYRACVSFLDAQVGLVLKKLEALGLHEDTIVALWGDHGWHLGDHGWWCKHTNFEQATRAPLLCRAPGVAGGVRTDALVEFVDIYPSLAELAGLTLPEHLEGTSFAPVLKDPKREWKKAAWSQYPRGALMGYTMRSHRFRYTEWKKKDGSCEAVELYDYEKDPLEKQNHAGKPEYAAPQKELKALFDKGWQGCKP